MKKYLKFMIIMVILPMIVPFVSVKAATKTDAIVDMLKESAKSYNGEVKYEDDMIDISWNIKNSESNSISYSYNGNIIEYNSGEINSYEQATDVTSHLVYSIYLIQAALRLNGYSDEQITSFFTQEDYTFNYDINGIEFKNTGDSKKFTSQDGSSTIQAAPSSVKIDIKKANLNTSSDEKTPEKNTTINDIVNNLNNDEEFTVSKLDGKVVYENEVESDESTISINHTYYWEDYHNVSFWVNNDVLTYEDDEFDSYYSAELALSHQMYALQILSYALRLNGYTDEQVLNFISNNEFNYELNGVELKELEESKKYVSPTSSDDYVDVNRMSIKIDFNKANLNVASSEEEKVTYNVIDGAGQTINISDNKDLTFRFDIDYSKFVESGKVYVDDNLVDSSNYTSTEGSTIITFNSNYTKTLSSNEHTLKVAVADGDVSTTFSVKNNSTVPSTPKTSNPQTGDNILLYVFLLGLSLAGIVGIGIYTKKRVFN